MDKIPDKGKTIKILNDVADILLVMSKVTTDKQEINKRLIQYKGVSDAITLLNIGSFEKCDNVTREETIELLCHCLYGSPACTCCEYGEEDSIMTCKALLAKALDVIRSDRCIEKENDRLFKRNIELEKKLAANEARILLRTEVRFSDDIGIEDRDVFIEVYGQKEIFPAKTPITTILYNGYMNHNIRFWSAMPTEEQRKKEKW